MRTLVTPFTRVLGVVLLLVGLLGFFMSSPLLGLFEVDTLHNIIHIASGLVALAVSGNMMYARMYLLIFGLVYLVVALVGFFMGGDILGLFHTNLEDNILHTAIALGCLGVWGGSK
ncbi:DUF4383 domain-containing protein [Candidatus Peribacteria bacterium]|nr:DUF4383 domain-containing protein [Candidatus Peribacteria bacterium]